MVMKQNRMRTNLLRSIRNSLGRYLAILAIIALGAGFFTGLRVTKSDMIATTQAYIRQQNMFDLRLISSYGWSKENVYAAEKLPGIRDVEGSYSVDALMRIEGRDEDSVYRLYSIPNRVNRVELVRGRMPSQPDECLADSYHGSKSLIGTRIQVSRDNSDSTLEAMAYDSYTIVGLVTTPLYMNMERGSTSVGNGSISTFLYLPMDGFTVDYYTELYATMEGEYDIYSPEYNDAMDAMAERLVPQLEPIAQDRLEQVRRDAEAEYADGLREYEDGRQEYEDAKADAERQLEDAAQQLADGRQELEENRKKAEDGRQQIEDGEKLLEQGEKTMLDSQKQLAQGKQDAYAQLAEGNATLLENYKTVVTNLRQVENGLDQIDRGIAQLDDGIAQMQDGIRQIDDGVSRIDLLLQILTPSLEQAEKALEAARNNEWIGEETIAELEQELENLRQKEADYRTQREELLETRQSLSTQLEELLPQQEALAQQKSELEENRQKLLEAKDQLDLGFLEAQSAQTQADNQFAAAQAQMEAARQELEQNRKLLESKTEELEQGEQALAEGEQTLADGEAEYEQEKQKAQRELDRGQKELDEGWEALEDARQSIDDLADPTVLVLTRNTNVGYVAFESDSDIVEGVSRVFPAFFLLVAALVCITTMTRMVDEERTQIGILKALGYGSGAIIGKYLIYSGSAALLGCVLGVVLGSIIFPEILWQVYGIMYSFTGGIHLQLDVPLCAAIVLTYTGLTLLVTWYCCRRELKDVPAELIRPKPPASGKKVIFERFRFWNSISFLNKVAIRNIFRYRQRLAMMLLGIGGCAALLLTGFGIKDSIADIVAYQFEKVTVYDIAVSFRGGQDAAQQQTFREKIGPVSNRVVFCYEGGGELDFHNGVKNVQILSPEQSLEGVLDLHRGRQQLDLPGLQEALISRGVAEAMGIRKGDQIEVCNSDMETMHLTVSGIFDNYIYNYVLVSRQTLESQWDRTVESQTALVLTAPEQDVHEAGALIAGQKGVTNLTISRDMAERVGSMMKALDSIVWLVVICAALLAVIVLYNLTNINITERVREIATIKVLGFHAGETVAYVFKENLALSAMGAVLGLGLGKLLHVFVMDQIRIDMVWFQSRIKPVSFLLAIGLTMLSAICVDVLLYFKLQRINMAEALKSVE